VRIKKSRQDLGAPKKELFGRVSSVMKQIDSYLRYIDESRVIMKRFPNIKTSRYTVALAGYPNVGKSSLLARLTLARPEIRNYAFTTKSLNIGYMEKTQIVDTPGAFDRDDMNPIERQAYLVLRLVADLIVFVIDPTEECGYPVKAQKKLLLRLKKLGKPVITVNNKADMMDSEGFSISAKTGQGIDELAALIKEHESSGKKKNHKD